MISLIKKKAQTRRSQFVDILSQDCQLGMKKKQNKENIKQTQNIVIFTFYRL